MMGGEGERIGGEKHNLKINGKPMISHITETLEKVFEKVIISGKTTVPSDYPCIKDEIPDKGPLGGIYSCLKYLKESHVFFSACDMPFISEDLPEVILESPDGHDAYVPIISENFEPLCAVYSNSCLSVLDEIVGGDHRIRKLLDSVDTYYIEEEEFEKIEGYRRMFFNVNTPGQLEKARDFYREENKYESQSQ